MKIKSILRNKHIILNSAFFTLFFLFTIYFFLCFPTFIVNKNGGVGDPLQWLWDTIINFIIALSKTPKPNVNTLPQVYKFSICHYKI